MITIHPPDLQLGHSDIRIQAGAATGGAGGRERNRKKSINTGGAKKTETYHTEEDYRRETEPEKNAKYTLTDREREPSDVP